MKHKLLFLFLVLVTAMTGVFCESNETVLTTSPPENCTEMKRVTDRSVYEILYLFNPKNREGYSSVKDFEDRYCKPFNGWLKDALKFKKCLKLFPRTVVHLALANTRKSYQMVCKDSATVKKSYRHSKCINPVTYSELAELRNKVNNVLGYAANVTDIDEVIPSICCGIYTLIGKVKSEMTKTCTRRRLGLPDTPDFIVNLIEVSLGDMMDLMCGKFKTIKDCETHASTSMKAVDEILNQEKQREADHSPILPLIAIVQRLDGQVNL